MNYIFGNNTLYPRSSRVGGTSGGQGAGLGVKQKLGPKRGSSEELAPPHTSSPSTSSPASSSPSTSSSRWQQLLTFFSRRSAFTDCITSSQVTASHIKRVCYNSIGVVWHQGARQATSPVYHEPVQRFKRFLV